MQTLPVYDDYMEMNLAPVRKLLEKRTNTNGLSSEGLFAEKDAVLRLIFIRSFIDSTKTISSNTFSSTSELFFQIFLLYNSMILINFRIYTKLHNHLTLMTWKI